MISVLLKTLSECSFIMIYYTFLSDMSLLFLIFCEQIIIFRSDRSALSFFKKNYYYNIFTLFLKSFIKSLSRIYLREEEKRSISQIKTKRIHAMAVGVHGPEEKERATPGSFFGTNDITHLYIRIRIIRYSVYSIVRFLC